ncbi:MAG TPA: hypothetical protein VFV05_02340 [Methylomirabilota bacterium]|nr:hypothetical protein [Methylomirabilota bacterium]
MARLSQLCLAFLFMAFRAMSLGHGFMCAGGHRESRSDEIAELRREIHALRDEIKQGQALR